MKSDILRLMVNLTLCVGGAVTAMAQGTTAFSYSGRLLSNGAPGNGNYELRFALYDAAMVGTPVGSPTTLTLAPVGVTNGLFTVALDFGSASFAGSARWLEIAVRTNGSASPHTVLSPRQLLTPVPYALFAPRAATANTAVSVPWSALTGIPPGFADGIDHGTNYSAGAGLTSSGTAFSIMSQGVSTDMLADAAVVSNKLANSAVSSAKLQDAAVGSNKLADAAVTAAKLADASVTTNKLSTTGASAGQILKFDGNRWGYAADNGTSYSSGAGLSLLGATFSVNFAGSGSAATAARSDHTHDAAYINALGDTMTGLLTLPANGLAVGGHQLLVDNGAVGIGTTNPQTPLHLYSSQSPATLRLQSSAGFGAARMEFWSDPLGSPNEWRPGFVQSTDNGNFTGGLAFYVNGAGGAQKTAQKEVMRLVDGKVGIGTTSPSGGLHVSTPGPYVSPQLQLTQTTPGDYARIRMGDNGPSQWDIAAGTGSDRSLHFYTRGANQMTISTNGTVSVNVLTINGADVAEPFEISTRNLPKGSVVCIDEDHPGQLKLSERSYDKRVAGILSGANGIRAGICLSQEGFNDGGENVALSGRVYVLADAANGPIKPGDLLTTSDSPGHAMKVSDHARAQGAILGKAMSALPEGKAMVLVLVTLQ